MHAFALFLLKIAQDNKGNKIQAPLGIIYHVALGLELHLCISILYHTATAFHG